MRKLEFLPELAKSVGLNKAIVICTLHSQLKQKNTRSLGCSYDRWCQLLPFWSPSTVKRTILSLEQDNILLTEKLGVVNNKFNHTKVYTLNYDLEILKELKAEVDDKVKITNSNSGNMSSSNQNEPIKMSQSKVDSSKLTCSQVAENTEKITESSKVSQSLTYKSYIKTYNKTKKKIKS